MTNTCSGRRARPIMVIAALSMLPLLALTGCREWLPLNNDEALLLSNPQRRHDIRFSEKTEALMVAVVPGGQGLSSNQEVDVAEFAARYKTESTGRLRISTPVSPRDRGAVERSVAAARSILLDAGVPPSAVEPARHRGDRYESAAIRLSFERPVAIAPSCGSWPEDLGPNRERVNFTDLGCSTQRSIAVMAANPRDLMGPQPELPRSSERRSVHWSEYTKSGNGGGASAAAVPVPAGDVKPGGTTKK